MRPISGHIVSRISSRVPLSVRTPAPVNHRGFASAAFEAAAAALQKLPEAPGNTDKLKLYALFKQATIGKNSTPKPGMFDVVGKYKWEAWANLKDMSQAEAEQAYIALCAQLGAVASGSSPSVTSAPAAAAAAATPTANTYTTLEVSNVGGVRTVMLARPDKRNAISFAMYNEIIRALSEAASDPATRVVVLTGKGAFYSSGNDLTNFMSIGPEGPAAFAEKARIIMEAFVAAFIHFPKLLFVAANGPAVGIATTTLPLADFVIASHKATFSAPLVGLGMIPEACSSLTFPALMGHAKATEILVLGKKLSAAEALDVGLVGAVVEDSVFREQVALRAAAAAALPPQAVLRAKKLMRGAVSAGLDAANHAEGRSIVDCWLVRAICDAIPALSATCIRALLTLSRELRAFCVLGYEFRGPRCRRR